MDTHPSLILALLACVTAVSSGQRGPGTAVTAFVNVAVVPMDSEHVLTRQTVLVQGARITAIGPVSQVHIPASALRIDGRGKFLMPGLADMHFHAWNVDSDSAEAEHFLMLVLAHGVTTIRNMDWEPMFYRATKELLRWRARAATGALLSPRIYTSGPWFGATVGRPADAATAIPAYKAAGYDFVKIHDEDRETFDSVMAAAHRAGIPVVGHVPDGVSPEQALVAGYQSIEHLMGTYRMVKDSSWPVGLKTTRARPTRGPSQRSRGSQRQRGVPASGFVQLEVEVEKNTNVKFDSLGRIAKWRLCEQRR